MFNFKAWFHRLTNHKNRRHPGIRPTVVSQPSSALTSVADDHNDFALALYEQLSQRPGNVFFSPLSVRVACAMAYVGARGETAAQMSGALRLPSEDTGNRFELIELIHRLSTGSKEYEIALANGLWSQAGSLLQPEFVEQVSRLYGGHVDTVDFRGGGLEAARADINRWIDEKTNHLIQELVPAGGVDSDTRLSLANAVYFKGWWEKPFDEFATNDDLFYPEHGDPEVVPLMRKTSRFWYVQTKGFQAVELDYKGGDLSMVVLLPEKNKLRDFEAKLSTKLLDGALNKLSLCKIELYLPRFKMSQHAEFSSELSALGMPLAFTRGLADFSGINSLEPPHDESLFVSRVFHQAMVEVNESGTEAAAATLANIAALCRPEPVPVFRADHPFLFAIRDKNSGAIVFLGRVDNPESGR